MIRPLRIEFAGAVYHLTSGGIARQALFFNEKDFVDFLGVLSLLVKRYHFLLHAYCLMNNHDQPAAFYLNYINPVIFCIIE